MTVKAAQNVGGGALDQSATTRERGQPIGNRRVLDSLPSHARTTSSQAAARSRLVKRLRLALPIFAITLIAIFIFNSNSREGDEAFLNDFKDLSASAEELRMANPRFAGIDENGKPFEITAESAVQEPGKKDVVQLESPRAVQGNEKDATVVTAENGVYRSEANILELREDVTLEHEIGADTFVFRSPSATVLIKDEIVTSNAGVGGEGPKGEALRADRMKAYNNEGRVVLEGNVSMRIYPNSGGSEILSEQAPADTAPPLKDIEVNPQ